MSSFIQYKSKFKSPTLTNICLEYFMNNPPNKEIIKILPIELMNILEKTYETCSFCKKIFFKCKYSIYSRFTIFDEWRYIHHYHCHDNALLDISRYSDWLDDKKYIKKHPNTYSKPSLIMHSRFQCETRRDLQCRSKLQAYCGGSGPPYRGATVTAVLTYWQHIRCQHECYEPTVPV